MNDDLPAAGPLYARPGEPGPIAQPGGPGPVPQGPGPAGKAGTLLRLRRLKRRIAILAVVGFGVLSGLTLGHRVGATAQSGPAGTSVPVSTVAPTPAPSVDNGGGFFNQGGNQGTYNQGGDNQGGYNGGYGFGSGYGSGGPVAGSGAS